MVGLKDEVPVQQDAVVHYLAWCRACQELPRVLKSGACSSGVNNTKEAILIVVDIDELNLSCICIYEKAGYTERVRVNDK